MVDVLVVTASRGCRLRDSSMGFSLAQLANDALGSPLEQETPESAISKELGV